MFLVFVSLVKLVLGKDDDLAVWSRLRGRTHIIITTSQHICHHTTSQTHIIMCMQIQTGIFQVVCYLLSDLKVLLTNAALSFSER